MTYSKSLSIVVATALSACVIAVDASAQSRGRSGGGSRGPSVGRSAPRGPSGGYRGPSRPGGGYRGPSRDGGYRGPSRSFSPRSYAPRYYGSRFFFPRYAPFSRYYYPYRSGFSFGLSFGYPYSYGYPYGYAGYPYYGYPSYGYPSYGYPSYGYPYSGSSVYGYPGYAGGGYVGARGGDAYGEVRIEDAPKDAQVYADGRLVGSVGDFDGPVRHLPLEAGPHEIEIRITGMPPLTYDVDVRPGQTLTIHANVR
jgi:PEGA domain-containing protein